MGRVQIIECFQGIFPDRTNFGSSKLSKKGKKVFLASLFFYLHLNVSNTQCLGSQYIQQYLKNVAINKYCLLNECMDCKLIFSTSPSINKPLNQKYKCVWVFKDSLLVKCSFYILSQRYCYRNLKDLRHNNIKLKWR